ncbi:hypothetical protein SNE40_015726 [Patella caerulea]|uniref:28S ribosomal protein S22, mitochondrial n=1 Tax=Patella caerulea TaxID=87958 RepID=A0AAN8PSG5_PATCE
MAASSRRLSYCLLKSNYTALLRQVTFQKSRCVRSLSSAITTETGKDDKDPFVVFRSQEVQRILKKITGLNVEKVSHMVSSTLKKPTYKLLTEEETQEAEESARKAAEWKLQMPPFMLPRKPIHDILSKDPDLEGFDSSKYVFTDISFGVSNKERLIVVRDTDGTLRKADWDERDRVNQVYNPTTGQVYIAPKMFDDENLERVLNDDKYIYMLDRACVQFEPDNPDFIRVTHKTFEHINKNRKFDVLRSTRHFGPMTFYLTWNNKIDLLLVDMIHRGLMDDCIDVVNLYVILHPTSKTANNMQDKQDIERVKTYCQNDAENKAELELSIQAFEDSLRGKSKQTA